MSVWFDWNVEYELPNWLKKEILHKLLIQLLLHVTATSWRPVLGLEVLTLQNNDFTVGSNQAMVGLDLDWDHLLAV